MTDSAYTQHYDCQKQKAFVKKNKNIKCVFRAKMYYK